jgi:hypothetical protein
MVVMSSEIAFQIVEAQQWKALEPILVLDRMSCKRDRLDGLSLWEGL